MEKIPEFECHEVETVDALVEQLHQSPLRASLNRMLEEGEPPTVASVNRLILRPAAAQLTRQRSDLQTSLDDALEEQTREKRSFYTKLLSVVDGMDRVLQQADPENDLAGNLESLRTKFLQVLEDEDVLPIELAVGQPFDAATCEVSQRRTRDDLPPDTIISIDRKGYTCKSKLLRRARVVISVTP
ncbi:MAG TPA: nucleotide exchange factor GrpE [Anaerolineaceae bacterium]|nr:nucleotide exchange factor GrpE [Anaerolineaceae bacterium]HPN50633.1 nucleotide exchange factor GrpE [Anaerolineaceae bacterium]